jgi:hypothetical protein
MSIVPRPKKSWKTSLEVRNFFDSLAPQLHISQPDDWYRISGSQVNKLGGMNFRWLLFNTKGYGLLAKFGKLFCALQYGYPEISWDEKRFSYRGKKSAQR